MGIMVKVRIMGSAGFFVLFFNLALLAVGASVTGI